LIHWRSDDLGRDAMKKVDDIVAAAERLDARDFIRLRQKFDQLEKSAGGPS
jgi:hypothetical protein